MHERHLRDYILRVQKSCVYLYSTQSHPNEKADTNRATYMYILNHHH